MPPNPKSLGRPWRHGQWRATGWEPLKEYASGALWVLPSLAALLALAAGFGMSQIQLAVRTPSSRVSRSRAPPTTRGNCCSPSPAPSSR